VVARVYLLVGCFINLAFLHDCVYSIQIIAIESQLPLSRSLTSHPSTPCIQLLQAPLANNGQPHRTAKELGNRTAGREVGPEPKRRTPTSRDKIARGAEQSRRTRQTRRKEPGRTNETHAKKGKRERKTSFTHRQVPHTRAQVDRNPRNPNI